jgi:hypothetical protein
MWSNALLDFFLIVAIFVATAEILVRQLPRLYRESDGTNTQLRLISENNKKMLELTNRETILHRDRSGLEEKLLDANRALTAMKPALDFVKRSGAELIFEINVPSEGTQPFAFSVTETNKTTLPVRDGNQNINLIWQEKVIVIAFALKEYEAALITKTLFADFDGYQVISIPEILSAKAIYNVESDPDIDDGYQLSARLETSLGKIAVYN